MDISRSLSAAEKHKAANDCSALGALKRDSFTPLVDSNIEPDYLTANGVAHPQRRTADCTRRVCSTSLARSDLPAEKLISLLSGFSDRLHDPQEHRRSHVAISTICDGRVSCATALSTCCLCASHGTSPAVRAPVC